MVLLPDTSRAGGESVAQDILRAVATRRIRHEASPTGRYVSVSIGIGWHGNDIALPATPATPAAARARRDEHQRQFSANDLLLAADRALYRAKHAGRAQACLSDLADLESPPGSAGDPPAVVLKQA